MDSPFPTSECTSSLARGFSAEPNPKFHLELSIKNSENQIKCYTYYMPSGVGEHLEAVRDRCINLYFEWKFKKVTWVDKTLSDNLRKWLELIKLWVTTLCFSKSTKQPTFKLEKNKVLAKQFFMHSNKLTIK